MAGAVPRPEHLSYFIEIVTFLIIGYSSAQVQRLCNGGMNLQMVGRPIEVESNPTPDTNR